MNIQDIDVGDLVLLNEPEDGEYVPAGWFKVAGLYSDGSFWVQNSKIGIWPKRVIEIKKKR